MKPFHVLCPVHGETPFTHVVGVGAVCVKCLEESNNTSKQKTNKTTKSKTIRIKK